MDMKAREGKAGIRMSGHTVRCFSRIVTHRRMREQTVRRFLVVSFSFYKRVLGGIGAAARLTRGTHIV